MPKRKKRLKKGIQSIEEQIEKHKEKLEQAIEEGKIELANYYEKEIKTFSKNKEKKKGYLK